MLRRFLLWIGTKITRFLVHEEAWTGTPLCDFRRLTKEIKPGDVLLLEGRSRVSNVIKLVTQSSWTHSALYIGCLKDLDHADVRECLPYFYNADPDEPLLIEALLGEGTVLVPLAKYEQEHLRICRPKGLSPHDTQKVIHYAAKMLGSEYDVRQLLDLGRFVFPWAVLPRRWRSSLFAHNAGAHTRIVCSGLLAEAFSKVKFPILPFVHRDERGILRLFQRNPRLFTPKDFDYSPYFDIVKYPYLGINDIGVYRKLPWMDDEILYNDERQEFQPVLDQAKMPARQELWRLPAQWIGQLGNLLLQTMQRTLSVWSNR